MEQSKAGVDPFRPAKDQVSEILEKVQAVLPISMESVEIEVRVPMQHAGRASAEVRHVAPVKSEEWRSDAWVAVLEIPAGMQSEVYDTLNRMTGGSAQVKILKEHKI
jgi:ribosome maturation protein SDO1